MFSFWLKATNEILTCKVCKRPLKNTVFLPCGESMCSAHVSGIVNYDGSLKNNVYKCLVCHQDHEMPTNGVFTRNIVLNNFLKNDIHLNEYKQMEQPKQVIKISESVSAINQLESTTITKSQTSSDIDVQNNKTTSHKMPANITVNDSLKLDINLNESKRIENSIQDIKISKSVSDINQLQSTTVKNLQTSNKISTNQIPVNIVLNGSSKLDVHLNECKQVNRPIQDIKLDLKPITSNPLLNAQNLLKAQVFENKSEIDQTPQDKTPFKSVAQNFHRSYSNQIIDFNKYNINKKVPIPQQLFTQPTTVVQQSNAYFKREKKPLLIVDPVSKMPINNMSSYQTTIDFREQYLTRVTQEYYQPQMAFKTIDQSKMVVPALQFNQTKEQNLNYNNNYFNQQQINKSEINGFVQTSSLNYNHQQLKNFDHKQSSYNQSKQTGLQANPVNPPSINEQQSSKTNEIQANNIVLNDSLNIDTNFKECNSVQDSEQQQLLLKNLNHLTNAESNVKEQMFNIKSEIDKLLEDHETPNEIAHSFDQSTSNKIIDFNNNTSNIKQPSHEIDCKLQVSNDAEFSTLIRRPPLEINTVLSLELKTSFENPSRFWLFFPDQAKETTEMSSQLEKWCSSDQSILSSNEIEQMKPGQIVSCYIEAKKVWCRGRLLLNTLSSKSNEITSFEIELIDYGEIVKCNKVFKELSAYKDVFPLAIKCYLHNIKPLAAKPNAIPKWSTTSVSRLVKYWTDLAGFQVKILSIDQETNSYGVDFINQYSSSLRQNPLTETIFYLYNIQKLSLCETFVHFKLASLIIESPDNESPVETINQPKYTSMKTYNPNECIKCNVAFFEQSLDEFYLKEIYEWDALVSLMEVDYSKHESSYKIVAPFENMPVAVKYTDEKWYRGLVKTIKASSLKAVVFFIDYGNEITVSMLDLRYLKPDFFKYEVSIFKCKLFNVRFAEIGVQKCADFVYNTISKLAEQEDTAVHVKIKRIMIANDVEVVMNESSKVVQEYEILLRYSIDGVMSNLNVILNKMTVASKQSPFVVINSDSDSKNLGLSVRDMWIQDVEKEILCDFDLFQKSLNRYYASRLDCGDYEEEVSIQPKARLNVNDYCVIKKKGAGFFRAQIREITTTRNRLLNKFKVICVDMSDRCEEVSSENVFAIVDEFSMDQKILVKLKNFFQK